MCKIKKITPKQKQNKSKGKNVKVSLLELENQTNGINVIFYFFLVSNINSKQMELMLETKKK